MMQEANKYFYCPYFKGGGLDSKIIDLRRLIEVAVSIGRIPIINTTQTSSHHRLDQHMYEGVPVVWDRYINLSATKILKIEPKQTIKEISAPLQYVHEQDFDFGSYSEDQIRYIGMTQLNDKENKHYPIICLLLDEDISNLQPPVSYEKLKVYMGNEKIRRRNSRMERIGQKHPLFVVFSPSEEVNNLTNIVLKHFGTTLEDTKILSNIKYDLLRLPVRQRMELFSKDSGCYACMHVRYGDNQYHAQELVQKSSELKKAVMQVVAKVYRRHNRNVPLYIMSNIMMEGYFDFLKPKYDIYRHTDFKKLREKFSEPKADPNLLYAVEKNLMRYATVKIFSFGRNIFDFEGPWCWEEGIRKFSIKKKIKIRLVRWKRILENTFYKKIFQTKK